MIREDFFHYLQDALSSERSEAHLARRRVEDPSEQGFLQLERFPHALFDAVLGQQVHHVDRTRLAESVDSPDPLFEPGGIPRGLKIDDRRGCLEIQSNSSGICRKENAAVGVVPEFLHERAAIPGRHAAVQRHESDPQLFQFLARQVSHPFVFAEDHHLATLFDRQFTDDLAKLGEFWRMIRLLVEKKGRVAKHPHVLQTTQDPLLVDFREPALPFPLAHQGSQDVILFPVRLRLLWSQGHVEDLVGAFGQIL